MEQLVFPVPNICEYLTLESQVRVFSTTERDDQGSKVNHFFQQFDHLYNEMSWQKKIRSKIRNQNAIFGLMNEYEMMGGKFSR